MVDKLIMRVQPAQAEAVYDLSPRASADLITTTEGHTGTVYLLLDHSYSMVDKGKLEQLKKGALRFFAEAFVRGYAVGAVTFSNRAHCLVGAGRNYYQFQRKVLSLEADGSTAMTDALRLATFKLRWRRGKRVMVLITDGQPQYKAAARAAALRAQRLGIELIAIGTAGADEAFLASLTPRPELNHFVEVANLETSVAASARQLPQV